MIDKSLSRGAVVGVAGRRVPPSRPPRLRRHIVVHAPLLAMISFALLPAFAQPAPPPEDIFKDGFDSPAPPPANDTCEAAQPLTLFTPANGTTVGAINNYDSGLETCTGYPQAGGDVAYSILLTSGQSVTVTLGAVYPTLDPSIAIVGPGAGSVCNASPVTCLKGADANGFGYGETFSYSAPTTGTYYIIVDSYYTGSGDSGPFTIEATSP